MVREFLRHTVGSTVTWAIRVPTDPTPSPRALLSALSMSVVLAFMTSCGWHTYERAGMAYEASPDWDGYQSAEMRLRESVQRAVAVTKPASTSAGSRSPDHRVVLGLGAIYSAVDSTDAALQALHPLSLEFDRLLGESSGSAAPTCRVEIVVTPVDSPWQADYLLSGDIKEEYGLERTDLAKGGWVLSAALSAVAATGLVAAGAALIATAEDRYEGEIQEQKNVGYGLLYGAAGAAGLLTFTSIMAADSPGPELTMEVSINAQLRPRGGVVETREVRTTTVLQGMTAIAVPRFDGTSESWRAVAQWVHGVIAKKVCP